MKHILLSLVGAGLILSLSACASDEDPQFRIRNERSDKANVQVQTSGGNTINLNDIAAGQTTQFQSAAEGTIVATAVIQNETASPTATFFAANDTRSTIVILAGDAPSLRIDQ